jgi:glycosyltransferase involved in cell wall biosynthesis
MNIELDKEKWIITNNKIKISNTERGIKIQYSNNKLHDYIYYKTITSFSGYSEKDIHNIEKNYVYEIKFDGYVENGLDVKLFINTYSKQNKLSSNSIDIGKETAIHTSKEVVSCKLAIRISGEGCAYINNIYVKGIDKKSYINAFLKDKPDNKYLVLTNIYPSNDDLYRNAFVHRRVKLYKEKGLDVDVYSIKQQGIFLSKYYFDDVEVYNGDYTGLEFLLKNKKYEKILIHFVNGDMIKVINKYCENTPVIIWIHGAEASRWRGRIFNYTKEEIEKNKEIWDKADESKMQFLRSIYTNKKYHFVIVSDWFRKEVCEKDADCKILNYSIIPNVVDENIFKYHEKNKKYRTKILSIRPYASNKYANDLSIKAILELSKRNYFNELEFNIYGKGHLFEILTKDIKKFKNVKLHETFITQYEITNIHKDNGIFLCPTRLDSQGVSMCEAMSSGLVCISNNVSAISEYLIDKECGILARSENYVDIADAIEYLYHNPDEYLRMSKNGSSFIQDKCGVNTVIKSELDIIKR